MRYYDCDSFLLEHHKGILYNHWASLGIAYILGDISLVYAMCTENTEATCNVSFTWLSLLETRKKQLEIACSDIINKMAKWLVPGILYRLKKR